MAALTAAVVLVGLICVADLLLTFGVVRRLRQHAEQLAGTGQPAAMATSVSRLAEGETPASFASVTLDEQPITGPAGMRMAAFFSTSCSACPGQVAPFVDYVTSHQLAIDDVLVVVLGAADQPLPYLDDLAEVGQIVFEEYGGTVSEAFKVSGFPAFCLLDSDAALIASGSGLATLPEPGRRLRLRSVRGVEASQPKGVQRVPRRARPAA